MWLPDPLEMASVSFPDKKGVNLAGRPRGRMSALLCGGCNMDVLSNHLDGFIKSKHIWRVTIPSLMSEKISLRSNFLGFKEASDFLARETSKSLRDQIQNSEADIFLFEVAGDFSSNHVVLKNTIFPDFRSNIFGNEWGSISFECISELKKMEIISPDTNEYLNIWKFYFCDFYKNILHKHIEDGRKIIFLARYLCEFILENGALRPHDQLLSIRQRNEKLRDIYEFLQNFDGIHNLYCADPLLYTSSSSPWGGPWEFHPDKEAYIELGHELLTVLAPQTRYPRQFLADQLANAGLERSRLDSERNAANAAREQTAQELHAARAQIEDIQTRSDLAASERDAANAAREQATQELQAAHALIHDLQTRADLAASERDAGNAAREQATQELEAAHALIHDLQTRADLMASERDAANAARDQTVRELQAARGLNDDIQTRADLAASERDEASAARDQATQELRAARDEIGKVQAQAAIDREDIASLRTELISYMSIPSLKISDTESQNRSGSLYSAFPDHIKMKRHTNGALA